MEIILLDSVDTFLSSLTPKELAKVIRAIELISGCHIVNTYLMDYWNYVFEAQEKSGYFTASIKAKLYCFMRV